MATLYLRALGWGILLAYAGFNQVALGQQVLAGQMTGVEYTDIVPDKVLNYDISGTNNTTTTQTLVTDSLDLDHDGRFDLKLAMEYSHKPSTPTAPYSGYTFNQAAVYSLHDDVAICASVPISQFPTNAVISEKSGVWSFLKTGPQWLTVSDSGDNTSPHGLWLDGQDGYAGVRLRTGAAGAWRYGWVRIQVAGAYRAMTVKDYALAGTSLALQAARAAGWQVYPSPVSQLVTIQPPTPTKGRLVVTDVCGRQQVAVVLSGYAQQVDLSLLPAGLYTMRFETASGVFTQRIAKQ